MSKGTIDVPLIDSDSDDEEKKDDSQKLLEIWRKKKEEQKKQREKEQRENKEEQNKPPQIQQTPQPMKISYTFDKPEVKKQNVLPIPKGIIPKSQPTPAQRTIIASTRQQRNPIMKHIKNVEVEYRPDIVPDFIIGEHACALYISMRYHKLYPHYLLQRIRKLNNLFSLRVVLCNVDVQDTDKALTEINQLCYLGDCTLILCWSDKEVARYLEVYRLYETKSAQMIQVKVENEYMPRLHDALTSIKSINKNDVVTLANTFGSLKSMMSASVEEISLCPGFGETKVRRLYDTFHASWKKKPKKKKPTQSKLDDFIKK